MNKPGLRTLGGGTTISRHGSKTVLTPGAEDVIVILQMKDQLHLIANGKDKVILSAIESKNLEITGERSKVFADKSVVLPIRGLQAIDHKVSSAAKAKIAHAKQRSFALGGMVQQQRIVAQFDKDPLLAKLSEQLFRMAHFYGGNPSRPTAPDTPGDLLRLMSEVARTLEFQMAIGPVNDPPENPPAAGDPEPLSLLLQGISKSLSSVIHEIKSGGSPSMESLGRQLTDALRQMFPLPAAKPGHIPLERRTISFKIDFKKAVQQSEEWNAAISQESMGKIGKLVQDKDAMAIAVPEEKTWLLRTLAQNTLTASDQAKGGTGGELINRILQSAESQDEFAVVLEGAGLQHVRNAILTCSEKEVTDFNVTAGAFHSAKCATDTAQAQLAQEALLKGYTRTQIIRATQEMHETRWHLGRKDDDLQKLVEKPLHMLVSTVSEKADMIKQLNDGKPNKRSNRAVVSLLESAQGKAEFDGIIRLTGEDIGKKFQDAEAKKKFSALAGLYERNEIGMGGDRAGVPFSFPEPGTPIEEFLAGYRTAIQQRVSAVDRLAFVETVLINKEREKEGKPPIQSEQLRQAVDAVVLDFGPAEKDKKAKIEELRKKTNINEYAMRNLITGLAQVYGHAADGETAFLSAQVAALQEHLRRAELRYGKISAQAETLRDEISGLQLKLTPHLSALQQACRIISDLYPAPKDWFEKS